MTRDWLVELEYGWLATLEGVRLAELEDVWVADVTDPLIVERPGDDVPTGAEVVGGALEDLETDEGPDKLTELD